MNGEVIRGGCLCGAVRYAVRAAPLGVEYCHCGMCRRHGGAPVAGWMDVPRSALSWESGQPRDFASSARGRRGFCGDCGSTLTFRWEGGGDKVTLALGSLDAPGDWPPRQHIYHAARLPWLDIRDDLPVHPAAAPDSGPLDAAPPPRDGP